VVVDLDWRPYWERRFEDPLGAAESLRMSPDGTIRSIGQTVNRIEDVQAQYIGLVAFRDRGVKALRRALTRAKTDDAYRRPVLGHRTTLAKLTITDVLDELAVAGDVGVKAVPIHGGWVDIDSPADLVIAEERWTSSVDSESPAGGTGRGGPAAGGPDSGGPAAGAPAAGGPPLGGPSIFRQTRRW
jgi:choline kinase